MLRAIFHADETEFDGSDSTTDMGTIHAAEVHGNAQNDRTNEIIAMGKREFGRLGSKRYFGWIFWNFFHVAWIPTMFIQTQSVD